MGIKDKGHALSGSIPCPICRADVLDRVSISTPVIIALDTVEMGNTS